MEARPPAENRHGGAPRGERPASWDAPRTALAMLATGLIVAAAASGRDPAAVADAMAQKLIGRA